MRKISRAVWRCECTCYAIGKRHVFSKIFTIYHAVLLHSFLRGFISPSKRLKYLSSQKPKKSAGTECIFLAVSHRDLAFYGDITQHNLLKKLIFGKKNLYFSY